MHNVTSGYLQPATQTTHFSIGESESYAVSGACFVTIMMFDDAKSMHLLKYEVDDDTICKRLDNLIICQLILL